MIYVISVLIFLLFFVGLSVGLFLKGKCVIGVCGTSIEKTEDGKMVCSTCGMEKRVFDRGA